MSTIAARFQQRVSEGQFTRDENKESHLCVYFAAFDPNACEVFLGHHKKSGYWLFNGGHLDINETPRQTLLREIGEEWGISIPASQIIDSKLITITKIEKSVAKIPCKVHYDIWYFIQVDKNTFNPNQASLATEFHMTKWLTPKEARTVVKDPNTLSAISLIQKKYFKAKKTSL